MTAGNRVFWPNRKSKHGLQRSSKTPYRHDARVFATTPPIAEDPMRSLVPFAADELTAAKSEIERLEAELLKRETMEQLLVDVRANRDNSDKLLEDTKKLLDEAQSDFDALRREHAVECDRLKAEARAARKEADPETIALKVMYGVDEATKEHRKEIAELRSIIEQRNSEIAELKRSKKRLREAIERLSRST